MYIKIKNIQLFFFALITGTICFFLIIGPRALNPTNIAWLDYGDPITHYLGWDFYRKTEWTLPVGLNPNYGLELSSSIVYSDSIPLLAILFKLTASFLPEPFQYFGIWFLLCLVFQFFFAAKLISLFTQNKSIQIVGALIFLFAPAMLWRLARHPALAAHFLILAGLYLNLSDSKNNKTLKWSCLLIASLLTHAYLFFIVFFLWIANIIRLFRYKIIQEALLSLITIPTLLICTAWLTGYFTITDGISSQGYGTFRLNLLAPFNPFGWSYVLPTLPTSDEIAGSNFLGLGVILLIIISIPSLLLSQKIELKNLIKKHIIIIIFLLLFTAFAISNIISFGPFKYVIELPDLIERLSNIFRASERMFWPAYYAIYLFFIYLIVRGYTKKLALSLLSIALLVQIIDTHAHWKISRTHKFMAPSSSKLPSVLKDPFWKKAGAHYTAVRIMMPTNAKPNWAVFAKYASSNNMATDSVYYARLSENRLNLAITRALSELESGNFDLSTLYILDSDLLEKYTFLKHNKANLVTIIDGYSIIAPGWYECKICIGSEPSKK